MRIACVLILLSLLGCATSADSPAAAEPLLTAEYRPAWRGPAWDLNIDTRGNVRLETTDYDETGKVVTLHMRRRLGLAEIEKIRQLMKDALGPGVLGRYDLGISDEDELTLVDSRVNRQVVVVGPGGVCELPEVQRFLLLWKEVVSHVKPPDWRRPTAYCGRG